MLRGQKEYPHPLLASATFWPEGGWVSGQEAQIGLGTVQPDLLTRSENVSLTRNYNTTAWAEAPWGGDMTPSAAQLSANGSAETPKETPGTCTATTGACRSVACGNRAPSSSSR